MNELKIHELIKCCNRYPLYHWSNGLAWVQCQKCGNRSDAYLARIDANIAWNVKREKQLKVENLYNGKQHWYKKEDA